MRKARVLYVDDEMGSARLLKMNLELTDRFEVCLQNWPEDALKTAREFKPDVVLLDLIMPHMPGGNVVAEFEKDPEMKEVPILFFTASVWRHQVEDHEGVICDHPCLAKPSNLDDIMAFLDANLPASARRDGISA